MNVTNQHWRLRPAFANTGGVVSAADGTASFVARGAAAGFYINSSAAFWMSVRNNSTADTLTDADAAPGVTGFLYGPFEFAADDKFVAVAGRGGAATIVVTLV